MILALLLACGPKIDPLAPMVQKIEQARRAGPDENPHLRFKLATGTVQDLVLATFNPEKPIIVPVMIGTVASIKVDLERPVLGMTRSPACDCTRAQVDARGTIDVEVGGLFGRSTLAEDLGFTAQLAGAPGFRLSPTADGGRIVQLVGDPKEPWTVDLNLDEEKGFLTNKLVDGQFEGPLANLLAAPITLATLPATMPVAPVKIRLEPGADPEAAVWFGAEPSIGAPPIAVEQGWGMSLTDTGLTAVLRRVLATRQTHPRWKLEPLSTELRGTRFTALVRVHRVAHKVQYRDYTVAGRVDSTVEGFTVVPETVDQVAKVGWKGSLIGGFITPTVRKQVLKQKVALPRVFDTPEGRFRTRWTVRDVDASDAGIFVRGDLELLPPDPTPVEPSP